MMCVGVMWPRRGMRCMIAAPVIDLPAPDSPTTPRTSPLAMEKLTSLRATSVPRRVSNSTRRFSTERIVSDMLSSLSQPGIERVAQPIAQEIDGQDQRREREAGEGDDPPLAGEQEFLANADERAERGLHRWQADPQIRQCRLGDDRQSDIDGYDHE